MFPLNKVEQYKDVIEHPPELLRMEKLLIANSCVCDGNMVANHDEEMMVLLKFKTEERV